MSDTFQVHSVNPMVTVQIMLFAVDSIQVLDFMQVNCRWVEDYVIDKVEVKITELRKFVIGELMGEFSAIWKPCLANSNTLFHRRSKCCSIGIREKSICKISMVHSECVRHCIHGNFKNCWIQKTLFYRKGEDVNSCVPLSLPLDSTVSDHHIRLCGYVFECLVVEFKRECQNQCLITSGQRG